MTGTARTWRQQALAVCFHFGNGAAISHRSAAVLRGTIGLRSVPLEVTVPSGRNRRAPGIFHVRIHSAPRGIPDDDVTAIDGIPVTKPARTLLDLASVEPEDIVERCFDDALRRRLISLPFLQRWLDDAKRRRHRGFRVLQGLVEERARKGITESPLETAVLRLLRVAALPLPMLQYVVYDGDRFIGRLDLAYPEERVAIEVDGYAYHFDRQSFDHDRARGNEIQALGWRVLRVTSKHIEEDPDGVTAWVRRALNRYP